jgi:menaquinone-dependent protoporphyrinogen IX oxidase
MKGIIIYKSNYGSTKQYAQWLTEETGYPAVDIKKFKKQDIESSDVVILGSPVFADKPVITGFIQKKWNLLKNKTVVLYTTSGSAPDNPKHQNNFKSVFKSEMSEKIHYFPQGGRMIFNNLTPVHKLLMKLGARMEKDPKIREEMCKDSDFVNRNGLLPVLEYLNKLPVLKK